MANELHVDAAGLRSAANSSDAVAAGLTSTGTSDPTSSQPSAAGVAAMNAALTSVQGRQSARMTGQAGDLTTSSARYDTTDTDGRDAISSTVRV
ncbi:type VII secretion target [Mycolicibacterium senegalense]|uniref:type VII secretion target n=1 Tax=Mycolicibacterium senegalense TaxID=1796 RepID=UPI003644DB89